MCGASENRIEQDEVKDTEAPKTEIVAADPGEFASGVTIEGDSLENIVDGEFLEALASLLFGDDRNLDDPETYVMFNRVTGALGFEYTGQNPIPGPFGPDDPEPQPTLVFSKHVTPGGNTVSVVKFDEQIIEAQKQLLETHDVDGVVFTAPTLRGLALAASRAADVIDVANGVEIPQDRAETVADGELIEAGNVVDPGPEAAARHPRR